MEYALYGNMNRYHWHIYGDSESTKPQGPIEVFHNSRRLYKECNCFCSSLDNLGFEKGLHGGTWSLQCSHHP